MNWYKWFIFGILYGFLLGFILWGFQVIPMATHHYKTDIIIDMTMANPVLIRLPSGVYFLVMEYEAHDDCWYLYDYMVYADGHWGARNNQWPLTLGINESYEIFMLPGSTFFDFSEFGLRRPK